MTRTLGEPGRRSSSTFWISSWVVLCVLGASKAHADPEKIALHPLVVPEVSEKDELEYRKLLRAEVARLEPGVASAAQVRAFLKQLPHQTCVSAPDLDNCLAELAKGIGARRALFVSLYVSPRIRFSGRVVRDTGEVRVPRLLGVFAAGRIIDETLARSQFIGGMTMGLGMALMEQTVVDEHSGGMLSKSSDTKERDLLIHASEC